MILLHKAAGPKLKDYTKCRQRTDIDGWMSTCQPSVLCVKDLCAGEQVALIPVATGANTKTSYEQKRGDEFEHEKKIEWNVNYERF